MLLHTLNDSEKSCQRLSSEKQTLTLDLNLFDTIFHYFSQVHFVKSTLNETSMRLIIKL